MRTPGLLKQRTQETRCGNNWSVYQGRRRGLYTMDYYSVTRKKEMLSFATIWMALKEIMLSEVSQTQKDKYYIFLYVEP